jgi:hypothetical protein
MQYCTALRCTLAVHCCQYVPVQAKLLLEGEEPLVVSTLSLAFIALVGSSFQHRAVSGQTVTLVWMCFHFTAL